MVTITESVADLPPPPKPAPSLRQDSALRTAEALRQEPPALTPDGFYLVRPAQLTRLLSGPSPLRWIGSPVELAGVVVQAGGGDEAAVRRLNRGKAFVVLADALHADMRGVPLAVCELDSRTPPALAPGDAIVARGEVWGTVPVGIPDVHCTSIARQ